MAFQLYLYQQELENMVYKKWKERSIQYPYRNKRSLIIQLPTGGGKTIIFSDIAKKALAKDTKVLIITHREELLSQTSGTLVESGLHPEIVNRYTRHSPKGNLIVAMTGTLARRILKPEWTEWYSEFGLIIIDEAHEQQFNWLFKNPLSKDKYILGFTATPSRKGKQRQLIEDYEDMVIGKDVQELINMGYLVTDKYFSVPIDISGVSKKGGDYDSTEMYNKYNHQELYSGIVENWNRLWKDTITLVFCCNIQHCINTCKAFNDEGIKAKFIVSKLAKPEPLLLNPTIECVVKHDIKVKEYANYIENFNTFSGNRTKIINEWKNGKFYVLINAGIATTGFDFRPIQTVLMYRVTTSTNLLQQIMGRGGRILNKKETNKYGKKTFFNFGDFGENCKRLNCYYRQQHEYSLEHEEYKAGKGAPAYKNCPKCKALVLTQSQICKYCGYIFPKSHDEQIAELVEINYGDAIKKLETFEDYDIYAKASGKSKNWVFRVIFIKWGRAGIVAYGREHHYSANWVYVVINRYKAQGIRIGE